MRCCLVPEEQRYEGTAGESLDSPNAFTGGGHEVTGQSRQQPAAPDRITVKGSPRLQRELKQGGMDYVAHGKALTASHIKELDDSEKERLYARYEARLGPAMTKTLGSAAL